MLKLAQYQAHFPTLEIIICSWFSICCISASQSSLLILSIESSHPECGFRFCSPYSSGSSWISLLFLLMNMPSCVLSQRSVLSAWAALRDRPPKDSDSQIQDQLGGQHTLRLDWLIPGRHEGASYCFICSSTWDSAYFWARQELRWMVRDLLLSAGEKVHLDSSMFYFYSMIFLSSACFFFLCSTSSLFLFMKLQKLLLPSFSFFSRFYATPLSFFRPSSSLSAFTKYRGFLRFIILLHISSGSLFSLGWNVHLSSTLTYFLFLFSYSPSRQSRQKSQDCYEVLDKYFCVFDTFTSTLSKGTLSSSDFCLIFKNQPYMISLSYTFPSIPSVIFLLLEFIRGSNVGSYSTLLNFCVLLFKQLQNLSCQPQTGPLYPDLTSFLETYLSDFIKLCSFFCISSCCSLSSCPTF